MYILMITATPFNQGHRTGKTVILLMLLVIVLGCSRDPDATYVDFTPKVTSEQPRDEFTDTRNFRVAIGSMVSAQETVGNYHLLLNFIADKLDSKVQLVQRRTYGEINELIGLGKIDLAFICSGPYVRDREKFGFEAVAMPEIRGSHFYQAYLIVNKDSGLRTFEDLSGKSFAFTDPESNTGRLVPAYWLKQKGQDPENFFEKTIYTYSHDGSIMAVAMSLVDGATVHGHIWEYYIQNNPIYAARSRVIKKSDQFGNPPVVVSNRLSSATKATIRDLLLNMHASVTGKKILAGMMIDRFVPPREECYTPIMTMIMQNAAAGDS